LPGPVIKTIDIETSPIESYTWGLWKQNVGLNQIKTEWTILSYSVKVLGKKQVKFRHTGGRGIHKVRDDSALLKELHAELSSTDIVVVQNGVRFDLPKISARMVMAGLPPLPTIAVVDTLLGTREVFAFTSHRLAWMSEKLTNEPKDEHKAFPGFELWVECLKDNPKAWAAMARYNRKDVRATEKVYLCIRPWLKRHPNVALWYDDDSMRCGRCGSDNLKAHGKYHTPANVYPRYKCYGCGGYSRGRFSSTPISKRRKLLSPI